MQSGSLDGIGSVTAIHSIAGALVVAMLSFVPLKLLQGLLGTTKLMGLYVSRLALVWATFCFHNE